MDLSQTLEREAPGGARCVPSRVYDWHTVACFIPSMSCGGKDVISRDTINMNPAHNKVTFPTSVHCKLHAAPKGVEAEWDPSILKDKQSRLLQMFLPNHQ